MAKRSTKSSDPRGRRTPGTDGRAEKAPTATDLTQCAASEFEASAEIREDLLPPALACVHQREDAGRLIAEAAKDIHGDSTELNGDRREALERARQSRSPRRRAVRNQRAARFRQIVLSSPLPANRAVACSPVPSMSCNSVRRR